MKKVTNSLIFLILVFGSCNRTVPEGETISFDNYKLFVKDIGKGKPTVIIEGGLACTSEYYDDIQQRISKYARVISYDHAGLGKSTPSPNPRTLPFYVKELKALLEYKKLEPPYILVGHSMGGHIVRYYAYLYPEEVAGLVFIDTPQEDWFEYLRTHQTPEDHEKFKNYFDPERSKYTGVKLLELREYESNCDSIRGKKIPPHIPVKMYTGTNIGKLWRSFGYHNKDMKVWAELQTKILIDVKDAEQVVKRWAGHSFHKDKPKLVLKGTKELINKYKANNSTGKN